MHGGFENETPNIPTNSIMKLDLMELFTKVPALVAKLEQTIGSKGQRNARSPNTASSSNSNVQWDGNDTSRSGTPPMQSLVRMNNKIKLDRAEIEQQPGGKTIHVPMQKFEEDKKPNQAGVAQPNM